MSIIYRYFCSSKYFLMEEHKYLDDLKEIRQMMCRSTQFLSLSGLSGVLAAYFPGYGLLFWTLGFGLCHILYGGIMHFKYERNRKK